MWPPLGRSQTSTLTSTPGDGGRGETSSGMEWFCVMSVVSCNSNFWKISWYMHHRHIQRHPSVSHDWSHVWKYSNVGVPSVWKQFPAWKTLYKHLGCLLLFVWIHPRWWRAGALIMICILLHNSFYSGGQWCFCGDKSLHRCLLLWDINCHLEDKLVGSCCLVGVLLPCSINEACLSDISSSIQYFGEGHLRFAFWVWLRNILVLFVPLFHDSCWQIHMILPGVISGCDINQYLLLPFGMLAEKSTVGSLHVNMVWSTW